MRSSSSLSSSSSSSSSVVLSVLSMSGFSGAAAAAAAVSSRQLSSSKSHDTSARTNGEPSTIPLPLSMMEWMRNLANASPLNRIRRRSSCMSLVGTMSSEESSTTHTTPTSPGLQIGTIGSVPLRIICTLSAAYNAPKSGGSRDSNTCSASARYLGSYRLSVTRSVGNLTALRSGKMAKGKVVGIVGGSSDGVGGSWSSLSLSLLPSLSLSSLWTLKRVLLTEDTAVSCRQEGGGADDDRLVVTDDDPQLGWNAAAAAVVPSTTTNRHIDARTRRRTAPLTKGRPIW
mmetsp:Transcript_2497/g.6750  ORF Transcript_2497/g.6750 Transcript_2497/m.6750 type:complete len:287 (-) Transcript_2497:84-944(-)